MSSNANRNSPQWQWEQVLIQAYYDHRWRELLEPLYAQFQRWKTGEVTHEAISSAIHEVHKQAPDLHNLFGANRDWLVKLIQIDRAFFEEFLKDHPIPPGVELMPPLPEP